MPSGSNIHLTVDRLGIKYRQKGRWKIINDNGQEQSLK